MANITLDELDKRIGFQGSSTSSISGQQVTPQSTEQKQGGFVGFLKGAAKGIISTASGIANLGVNSFNPAQQYTQKKILQGVGSLTGDKNRFTPEDTSNIDIRSLLPETLYKPMTPVEKKGFIVEQIAEYLIPFTRVKNVGLAKKILSESVEFGTRSSAQQGELDPEAFAIGGLTPVIARPLVGLYKNLIKVGRETLKSIFKATTSVPEAAISEANKFPNLVRKGFKKDVSATTIRGDILKSYKLVKSEMESAFKTGLEELRSLTPRFGIARTATGQFSAAKSAFEDLLQTQTEEGLPNVLRKYRISVLGGKLDFNRLNSSITNKAEQTQIQEMYNTLLRQKDFSVKGVQDVAARLNALRKFETSKGNLSSVVVSDMAKAYEKIIRKVYSKLADLRNQYSTMKGILRNVDAIVNASKNGNIKAISSSVKRLTNIFREDNDVYIDALKVLEQKSGQKFLSRLAGTEFQRIAPGILRTAVALGGIGVGAFFNPAAVLLIPLFSPRAVGGMITRTAQSRELLSELFGAAFKGRLGSHEIQLMVDKIIRDGVVNQNEP